MPRFVTGVVVEILHRGSDAWRLTADVDGVLRAATAFVRLTGEVSPGDRVVLNTTAADLGLGTGGEDFVLWNLAHESAGEMTGGHILKLRYTPFQVDTLAVEAPESPHHQEMENAGSISGMPVVACGLHSQIAPVLAALRSRLPGARVAYVMTDGAALPIAHSNLVARLSERGLIDATITCGHAFGGDYECVNIFSALAAAHVVARADATVVSMGPGVVGTSTLLGHTEMEQGVVLSAAVSLGGIPLAAVRISFVEQRSRHRPVSHHSLTALSIAAPPNCLVPIPVLDGEKMDAVMAALDSHGLTERHKIVAVQAEGVLADLRRFDLEPETMGRGVSDDPEFFMAAGAAGIAVAELLEEKR